MAIQNNTRANFRTDIRRRLNEVAAAGLWSDAELNDWIDRAVLRVSMDTEEDTSETIINLRTNVAWYSLPSDTLLPLFLYGPSVWDNARLFPTSLVQLDRNDRGIGTWEKHGGHRSTLFIPFSYDKFILWPPPDRNTTISIFYIPVPVALASDGTTTNLHLASQKLVPIYATYLALRKQDFRKAKLFLSEYKQRLAVVKEDIANTTATRPVRMAPAKGLDRAHGEVSLRMGSRKAYY